MKKTVLVSGASRGLGYCITRRHLKKGDCVHVIARCVNDKLSGLKAMYPELKIHCGDIARTELIKPALADICGQVSEFDCIYNVAGVFIEEDRVGFDNMPIDMVPGLVNVNACGALRVVQGLKPVISDVTRIINVSSQSGSIGSVEETCKYAYSISKAALNMATKMYYLEQGMKRRMIVVCPGWMRTDMGGPDANLDPDFSAEAIVGLMESMDRLPQNELFFKYDGTVLPW